MCCSPLVILLEGLEYLNLYRFFSFVNCISVQQRFPQNTVKVNTRHNTMKGVSRINLLYKNDDKLYYYHSLVV